MNITAERKFIVSGIFLLIGFIYLARIFYLQVIDDTYKLSANNNVLRYITEYPSRGLIYDRNGKLMVYNEAVYDLMIVHRQVKDLDTAEFCRLIGIEKQDFMKKIRKVKKSKEYSPVKPVVFEKQLSAETYAAFQEKLYKFPGFFVQSRTIRKYPQKIAAHVLGYIGEVDEKTASRNSYYRSGDYIGISGIEQAYEKELRGRRGLKIVMVDVFNRVKGSFQNGKHDTLALSGKNLKSSLDAELQEYGEALMQNKIGSVIAIEPSTGEILAMVCSPSYDPNLLVGRVRTQNYGKLLLDPMKPLFNRALMAQYPPGSTFKPIMGLVGQQEGVLSAGTYYSCNGGYSIGSKIIKCEHVHGSIPLEPAISHSCNTYFCNVFRTVIDNRKYGSTEEAFEAWRKYMLSFGIGMRLGIDLPHALKGSMPTSAYYNKYFGKNHWKSSTIISLGIGQGELGLNPLQLANMTAIIANRGYYYVPHVIKTIGDDEIQYEAYKTRHYCNVDRKFFDIVVEGMENVVERGTGAGSKIKDISICGKTGTAQNPHGKANSLFVGFAPKDNPRIAIAVVVENGGYGSLWAAPIASLMIEKFINDSISRPALEERMLNGNLMMYVKQSLMASTASSQKKAPGTDKPSVQGTLKAPVTKENTAAPADRTKSEPVKKPEPENREATETKPPVPTEQPKNKQR
jgi:penicillin-binding protein 2